MTGKSEGAFRTIGEVAESLDLPQHVLRFWETRFKEIEPIKRAGGRRYYRPRDVELVAAIRRLLYGEGYTIKGVQRILKEQGVRVVIESAGGSNRGVEFAPAAAAGEQPSATTSGAPSSRREAQAPDLPRHQPTAAAAPAPRSASPAGSPPQLRPVAIDGAEGDRTLGAEDIARLRAALDDLAECRRLLQLTRR
ncbi:MAG: MerR family transcriptional regulator [Methylocystis sp.]|nr:MerR family transcriptional regulator [Methylocystis sp.]